MGLSDREYELLQRAEKFYCEPCESLMPGVPNLPEPTVLPNAASEKLEWGSVIQSKFCQSVNSAYESIVHFRSNLFNVPSGADGKLFVRELTFWIKQINSSQSQLNSVALKAFMTLPALILQKPSKNSKSKEHTSCVKRRLELWKKGDIISLLKEVKKIQSKFKKKGGKERSPGEVAKLFARLVMHGKIGAALKLLDKEGCIGVHTLSEDVIRDLKSKHPEPAVASFNSLIKGPLEELPVSFVNGIDEKMIMKAALRTKGSAGPSGLDADLFRRILCNKNFSSSGKLLREEIATFTRNMLTKDYDPSLIQAFTSCRLIPLNKNPGIRPIGVGEVLRRIMGKAVSWNFKDEIRTAAGPLQTCASHGAGAEAAIHGMKEIFEDDSTEAVLLIDASNAFNRMNRSAALHNIRYQCPSHQVSVRAMELVLKLPSTG